MLGTGSFSPCWGSWGRPTTGASSMRCVSPTECSGRCRVTLAVSREAAAGLREGQTVALMDPDRGEIMGAMRVEDIYAR